MALLKNILSKIEFIEFIGNDALEVNNVIQINTENKSTDVLFWCNQKNEAKLNDCKFGTVVCSIESKSRIELADTCNYIFVTNPRLTFIAILNAFFVEDFQSNFISQKASIHPTAKIGKNVTINDFTVIEKDVEIGDHCVVGYHNVIHAKTIIKNNVKIGSNNTIGAVGFGYEKNNNKEYVLFPHIGNVLICEYVEIGNNNCIDKAVMGSTILHRNVKVDNLIHIAHGVEIGENTLVIAHAMIGGSTKIGKNVWVAPGALLINKIEISDDALIGMGAVVLKPVESKTIVAGNPAKFVKNNNA